MDNAYRITDWVRCYEVDAKGRATEDGEVAIKRRRLGALPFVRWKVRAPQVGPSLRRLKRVAAAAGLAWLEVYGMFGELLELAANQERDLRGWVLDDRQRPLDGAGIADVLDCQPDRIDALLAVLTHPDVHWVELSPWKIFAPTTGSAAPGCPPQAAGTATAEPVGGPADEGQPRGVSPKRAEPLPPTSADFRPLPPCSREPKPNPNSTELNSTETETPSASGQAVKSSPAAVGPAGHSASASELKFVPDSASGSDSGSHAGKRAVAVMQFYSVATQILDGRLEGNNGKHPLPVERDAAQRAGDATDLKNIAGELIEQAEAAGVGVRGRLGEALNLLARKCGMEDPASRANRPMAAWKAALREKGWLPQAAHAAKEVG